MQAPVYDGKSSINLYLKEVEKYHNYILTDKYNFILSFINEWTLKKFTSLSQFKNISYNYLTKHPKTNRSLVRKYCDEFTKKYNGDLTVGLETDSDEINDMYIIYLLDNMLKIINYKLIKIESGPNILYTIRAL